MKTISYWDRNTKLFSVYEKLYNDLVPDIGPAETINGELIRCVSNLFYEYCNNGNCNAKDSDIKYQYVYLLEFINTHCPDSLQYTKKVKKLIWGKSDYDFSQPELDVYNQLTDHVVKYVQSQSQ